MTINRVSLLRPLHVTLAVLLLASVAFAAQVLAAPAAGAASPDTTGAAQMHAHGGAPSRAAGTDIRKLCPGIDTALQSDLQAAWWGHGQPATLRVEMQVQGDEVAGVQLVQGPHFYGKDLKRAVRNLKCDAGVARLHSVEFEVRFTDEGDADSLLAQAGAVKTLNQPRSFAMSELSTPSQSWQRRWPWPVCRSVGATSRPCPQLPAR